MLDTIRTKRNFAYSKTWRAQYVYTTRQRPTREQFTARVLQLGALRLVDDK